MNINDAVDLLNVTGTDFLTGERVEFRPSTRPATIVGHRYLVASIAFDVLELESNKTSKAFSRLFLKRCVDAQQKLVIEVARGLEDLMQKLDILEARDNDEDKE